MDYTPVKPGEVATPSSSSYLLAVWRAAAGFYCVICHLLYWSVYYKIHNYQLMKQYLNQTRRGQVGPDKQRHGPTISIYVYFGLVLTNCALTNTFNRH